ncbi:Nuclear pore complex protein Nup98-Nup96 like protein [Argiope bruennichi]|uniref:Nuclear pore complex protein Nup98-Nup96 n=1 Tax=Argiope bruennichi TaxID=94029 RepID=A0A8T0FUR9_ARGBR|nr:Nuclear pore complex protein Nup98-Nup96 like protein [Argiope bruennichi]
MFGSSKPFGTASTFGASSFGNTSTPFGQNTNTFGAKPATSNVFGSSTFGVSTPSAPMSGGLFGSATPASGTGLFGQPSTAFGTPAATSTGGFGFGATSNTGGLFGSATPSTQSSGGLFGNTSTSAFGTPRPTFGGFGSSTTGTGLFGQNTSTGTGLFGSTGGFSATAPTGTTIKFNPPTGTDTMMKGGVSTSIGTRHQCITCMKEYENKSLEELRVEDYAANRKGSSTTGVMGFGAPAQQTSIFGTPAASTSAFSFGGTQSKPLFGTTGTTNTFGSGGLFGQPAQTQNTGLFGKPAGFGTPATSAAPVFNFGGTSGTSLFGQNNQQKPLFGQTTGSTGLFGNTATTQSTGFGSGASFGGFGATNQQSTGLFGAKPTGFGTTNTTTTNTFSFGNTNNMSGGGLFGQKPAAPTFGTGTGFGTQSTGFGSFGTTPSTGTSLFGQNKPATTGFGNSGNMFGGGLGTGFGNSSFSMGLGTNTGTGLFGTSTANKAPGFNFGNAGSTGFNFGAANQNTSSFNFGQPSTMPSSDSNNAAALQQAQQQILAMTVNPFGDSPLFRNPMKDSSKETEVLKPTNPSAQKALLNDNQYKVALLPTAKIKPKPWSPVPTGKVLLFDGLEDEEPSLGTAFLPKKSVKKLVLKNLSNNQSSLILTSNISPSQSTRIDVSISLKNPDNQQNKNSSESSPQTTPLTIDITNSNSEARTINVRQTSGSPAHESLSDPIVSKNLRVSFNNSMNDSIAALHTNKPSLPNKTYNVWSENEHEKDHDSSRETIGPPNEETTSSLQNSGHPTGIILSDTSYFTIPSLDSMIPMVTSDKKCPVKDFTVGRQGYGKVTFPGVTDVYGLNLDEIIIFGNKEINVYPDDEKKPPVGQGLNRKAKVILENVWPMDKTNHTLIKDPERITKMGYKEKIERCTTQLGATFIDYTPETGSWIFEVDHFSKYGLEDSDDEMDTSKPPEKKPNGVILKKPGEQTNGKGASADALQNMELKRKPLGSFQAQDHEMETLSSQIITYPLEYIEDEELMNEITSPTSPILTADIDAERIQGMKASFFHQDMDDDNWGPSVYNVRGDSFTTQRKDLHLEKSIFTSTKLHEVTTDVSKKQKYSEGADEQSYVHLPTPVKFSEIGVQNSLSSLTISESKIPEWLSDFPVVKSSSESLVLSSKPAPLTLNKIYLKPYKQSVLYDKQHLLFDAGYFMGRSFRVGWAGNGIFAYPRAPEGSIVETYQKFLYDANKMNKVSHYGSSFVVTLKEISSYSTEINNRKEEKIVVDALELQLENSVSSVEKNAPLFVPKPGVEPVHVHANLFESILKDSDPFAPETDFVRQCAYVWDLLVSLWGKVKGLDDDKGNSSYVTQIARREALSRWLIKTTEHDISKKITANSQHNDYLTKIFLHLSGRRIADAVKLAQMNNDFRLSLLLSQAEGNTIVRKLIAKQLDNWRVNGAYEFIKQNRIALYALLAGMLVYEDVNCCKNLNWKQTLSLQLWYHCNPNASVQEAIKEYDESFQGTGPNGKYAFPPYPLYMEELENSEKLEEFDVVFDTCYHILKLYCDRSYRFDLLLMPETYSTAHLDYRLSWLLHLSLSSIGYSIPADLASTLHMNFASQLESLNLWHWAVFVLLHHTDETWRIKQVKEVLLRNISLEQNEDTVAKEKFLIQSLLIPEKWIFDAKAVKANVMGKKAEEAWNLLKAERWSESHAVVIKYLASDAVINEDYEYLMKYLSELSIPERSSTILDWSNGGQVYLDYINMCRVVQEVLSREASAYDLEKFTPEVVSLCQRLSSIPAYSLKDRLSIAEMAKKTATILQSISILQASRTKNSNLLTMLASSIKNLPMPFDYAVSENRFVAHCFVDKITTEV